MNLFDETIPQGEDETEELEQIASICAFFVLLPIIPRQGFKFKHYLL